jgi:predicted transcriptional regulator
MHLIYLFCILLRERDRERVYEQVHLYLGELIAKGLIAQDASNPADGLIYRITEKGREFLLYYMRLVEFLEEKSKVELSTPYIGR